MTVIGPRIVLSPRYRKTALFHLSVLAGTASVPASVWSITAAPQEAGVGIQATDRRIRR